MLGKNPGRSERSNMKPLIGSHPALQLLYISKLRLHFTIDKPSSSSTGPRYGIKNSNPRHHHHPRVGLVPGTWLRLWSAKKSQHLEGRHFVREEPRVSSLRSFDLWLPIWFEKWTNLWLLSHHTVVSHNALCDTGLLIDTQLYNSASLHWTPLRCQYILIPKTSLTAQLLPRRDQSV